MYVAPVLPCVSICQYISQIFSLFLYVFILVLSLHFCFYKNIVMLLNLIFLIISENGFYFELFTEVQHHSSKFSNFYLYLIVPCIISEMILAPFEIIVFVLHMLVFLLHFLIYKDVILPFILFWNFFASCVMRLAFMNFTEGSVQK